MKLKVPFSTFVFAALFICATESNAQSGWYWQNPLPQGNYLFGVSFADANSGTAVGQGGTILRTTDGGSTWTQQSSGTTNRLEAVSFTDGNTGTAVGSGGIILRTTDGGATWTSQTSGTTEILYGVSFTDANTGTAVGSGGTILRTTDGGATWTSQSSGTTNRLEAVSFTDANTGTAVGSGGTILRTTDGGATWTSQTSGTTRGLRGVSFTHADTGTAVGTFSTILRTTDGGATWTSQSRGTTEILYGVSFTDANTGTAVGSGGTILRTTDGGATWTSQSSGTIHTLTGMSFADANTGTAVGSGGTILRTTNGGVTWTSQSSGTTEILSDVSFTDASTGTAVGINGTILRTTDGGATWTSQSSGTSENLNGVFFTDSDTGTAVGWKGIILRTTDGGATWTQQSSGITEHLYGVFFTDSTTGTAVGDNSTILRTTDGGATWTSQSRGVSYSLRGVSFTHADTGTAVGEYGVIFRTTDGGETWTSQRLQTPYMILYDVFFTDGNTGTAVGDIWVREALRNGVIFRTTDGGATWASQESGVSYSLHSVFFTDANTGTAVGSGGTIIRTTDGGATWTRQESGASNTLRAVSFTDTNTGTAVGWYGTILRTTTGGETIVTPIIVTDFSADPTYGHAPLTVQFSDLSTVKNTTVTSWNWDFDNDGDTDSEDQHPTWTYENVSTYDVSLTVSDGTDTSSVIKEDYITVISQVVADFRTSDTTVFLGNSVQFTDISTGNITSWAWDFEDDGKVDSEKQNPSWTYTEPDTYTVSLKVSDGTDTTSHTKEDFIRVLPQPEPVIRAIEDIPEDQGGFVGIMFSGSLYDCCEPDYDITRYSVWREMDLVGTTNLSVTINAIQGNDQVYVHSDTTYWEFMGGFPAVGFEHYAYTAPTIQDSSSTGTHWNTYLVIAHTKDTLFISKPDSGYSIDNLAPHVPGSLLASSGYGGINLYWLPNSDEDLDYYTVYRGMISGFDPGDPIGHTTDTLFVDTEIDSGIIYYYVATATDFNGNESDYSGEVSSAFVGIYGAGSLLIPTKYVLHQNYPNPFNPVTTLRYDLPEQSHITLVIYNLLGREIRTLVNRMEESGYKYVIWDATNNAGQPIGAGIYLYSIQAGTYTKTNKMILLK